MTCWHEQVRPANEWTFPNRQGTVAVLFKGQDVREAPFAGHFLRWEGEGEPTPMGWRRDPAGWFELWPRIPLLASSTEEAKSKFQPLMPGIVDGSLDGQFDRRPYQPPVRPIWIKTIEHPQHHARAVVVRRADTHYRVLYFVYAPDGAYFPAQTPRIGELGWEWGVPRRDTATLADTLGSAEDIAVDELAEIVAADSRIKRRDAGVPMQKFPFAEGRAAGENNGGGASE